MADIANKDAAFQCIDIARAALKAGEHAKAEKFAAKALKLYRCSQTESLVLQVQVYIAERTRSPGTSDTPQPARPSPSSNGSAHQHQRHQEQHDRTSTHQHSSRPHTQQQQHSQHAGERSRQQQPSSSGQHHQRPHGSSAHRQQQQQHPRGMGGSEGLRHRAAAAAAPEPPVQEDPSVTPEQRKVVQQILVAKSFYEVMGVAKDATEADIKSAYKKLALRLHPDKNKALRSDEAFKLLSKAFSCLSNADKRAYYDRTGYENSSAAQVAAASRRSHHSSGMSNGMGNGSFFYSGADEFDPEEIFNAFFGSGAFHPSASRVFRSQFGGYAQQQQQQRQQRPASREEQQRAQMLGLFQVLPILLIVLVTFFSSHREPVYSLARDAQYVHQLHTGRLGVPYWVKNQGEFDKAYPIGNYKRLEVERQVESDVYERTYQRCQNERMAQHRAFTWGNRDAARKMELASCQELTKLHEALGTHRPAGMVR